MVDFYGSGATVHSFRAAPSGAGFRLTERHEYYRGVTVTDIAWGPDSRLYLSDWGEGWGPNDKGNLFTITNETVHEDERAAAAIAEVRSMLHAGFDDRAQDELLTLLGHTDQRVRLAAQYELAERGAAPAGELSEIAHDDAAPTLRRVHAMWCLGQIARTTPGAADVLADLVRSPDEHIRRQTIRTLGDLRSGSASVYAGALRDASAAVRAEAAIALGKVSDGASTPSLLDALESNDDRDVFLRSALAYALELIGEPDVLMEAVAGRGRAARLGAVLALRRLGHVGVAQFLSDPDPGVVIEAARAVYDLSIDAGLPALARKVESEIDAGLLTEPFMRRAIEANVLLGRWEDADRLARLASNPGVPVEWRVLALGRLAAWDEPLPREGVWGDWVDLPGRPINDARRAVLANLGAIRAGAGESGEIRALADTLEVKYSLELDMGRALSQLIDAQSDEGFRLALLDQIAQREPASLALACDAVLGADAGSTTPDLRMRSRELLREIDPAGALPLLESAIESASTIEKQHSLRVLCSMDTAPARALVERLAARLASGGLDPALALEVFEAATLLPEGSPSRAMAAKLALSEPGRAPGFQTALLTQGGDPEAGREIFRFHEVVQCVRCHSVGGQGGTAGPDLTTVGSRSGRAALVQSVVDPGALVTEGFGEVSAMPPMGLLLKPAQVRDLVAYLATLQDPALGPAPETSPAPGLAQSESALPNPERRASKFRRWWAVAWIAAPLPVAAWLLLRSRRG
jgi:quinoprotein glucose dehydrogenase